MESIVKSSSDGFKDGVFLNGNTEYLPWPNKMQNMEQNPSIFYEGGMLNVYDETGGYLVINPYSTGIDYYNSDGSIRWSILHSDIYNTNFRILPQGIFYEMAGEVYYIGHGRLDSSNNAFFSIRLSDLTVKRGAWFSPTERVVQSIGILEDNTLYFVYRKSNNNGGAATISFDTMTEEARLDGCGYIDHLRYSPSSSSTQAYFGVSLFNGCLVFISASNGGNTGSVATFPAAGVLYGINQDFEFSTTKAKKALKTNHCLAMGRFAGLTQISKDVFLSRSVSSDAGYSSFGVDTVAYYSRAEIERWASDSIYSMHGIRIPKREV